MSISKRLYENTKRNGKCLEWTGYKDKNGYGRMSVHNKPMLVHRLAWELSNGPVPEGMCICHKCDNTSCIRIDHLFLGTHDDNVQDCILKGRDHKRGLKGENHNLAELTDAEVMVIRASDEQGKDLALRYGVAQTTISDVRKGRTWTHLPVDSKHISNKNCHITEVDVMVIRASKKDTKALAEEYGLTTRSVNSILHGETWTHLPGVHKTKGKGNFTGKFTREDVLHIRASDKSAKALAAKYGVHRTSITNIRCGHTWAHI